MNFFKIINKDMSFDNYDTEELQEIINKVRNVTPPIISVPKKFILKIKQQGYLESHPTWIGYKMLCATIQWVALPIRLKMKKELFFAIKPHIPVSPRFTEEGGLFRGVVTIDKNILDINNDLQQLNQKTLIV